MYYSYYGLIENPFKIAPDHRFLYLSETHKEALAALVYGLEEGHMFLLLTGEVGTGKTIVLDSFRINIDKNIRIIVIANPKISVEDFFYILSCRFDLEGNRLSKARLLEHLEKLSNEKMSDAPRTLLIIDEAQTLSHDLLEETRLLSNMPPSVLQIFLVGQPELKELLALKQFRSLDQRIGIRCDLRPMDRRETEDYIQHRLKIAGCKNYRSIFRQDALNVIYAYSGGIPRVINKLCDQALITGFAENVRQIPERIINQTIKELATEATIPQRRTPPNYFYKLLFTEIKSFSAIARIILFFILTLLAAILVMDLMLDQPKIFSLVHHTTEFLAEPRASQNAELVKQSIGRKKQSTKSDDVTELSAKEKIVRDPLITSVTASINPETSAKNTAEQPDPSSVIPERQAAPMQQPQQETPPRFISPPAHAAPKLNTVIVKQGDSLTRLIQTYYGEFNDAIFKKVTESNTHIKNPDTIYPGDKLNFPKISDATNSHQQ
jgi:general secretion pathway protein A